MDLGDLFDMLFDKKHQVLQRWLGGFFVGLPLAFVIGGGFGEPVDGGGIPLSAGWFREVFVVAMSIIGFLGVLLLLAGFSRRGEDKDKT